MTMTQASGSRYAPGYDLFKLIVAITLTAILFILMLRGCQPTPIPPTQTSMPPTVTVTIAPSATMTPQPFASPTLTPTPMPTSDPNACPSADSRLKVGDNVRVLHRLNFRAGPGLEWPVLLINPPGATMEVIGGPVCTTRRMPRGVGAYLWWKVRMPDGQEGWLAEASLAGTYYFIEPLQ